MPPMQVRMRERERECRHATDVSEDERGGAHRPRCAVDMGVRVCVIVFMAIIIILLVIILRVRMRVSMRVSVVVGEGEGCRPRRGPLMGVRTMVRVRVRACVSSASSRRQAVNRVGTRVNMSIITIERDGG